VLASYSEENYKQNATSFLKKNATTISCNTIQISWIKCI